MKEKVNPYIPLANLYTSFNLPILALLQPWITARIVYTSIFVTQYYFAFD